MEYTVEYYENIFKSDKWKQYWERKKEGMKKALEEYLINVRIDGTPRAVCAKKHHVSEMTLQAHTWHLRSAGIIPREDFHKFSYLRAENRRKQIPRSHWIEKAKTKKRVWIQNKVLGMSDSELSELIRFIATKEEDTE